VTNKISQFQNWQTYSWKNHIEQVLQKKNSASYAIKFVYCFSKLGTLKMIHIDFFHPVIKYGIIFWVKSTEKKSF
jgi:hypothetical protein